MAILALGKSQNQIQRVIDVFLIGFTVVVKSDTQIHTVFFLYMYVKSIFRLH